MAEFTLYHNPRCSKSRQTLALLNDAGVEPHVVEYLQNPPSTAELTRILELLKMAPRSLMRTKEDAYAENGLSDEALSDAELIAAMIANPILIERPIVVRGDRAVIGRPPENVNDLL